MVLAPKSPSADSPRQQKLYAALLKKAQKRRASEMSQGSSNDSDFESHRDESKLAKRAKSAFDIFPAIKIRVLTPFQFSAFCAFTTRTAGSEFFPIIRSTFKLPDDRKVPHLVPVTLQTLIKANPAVHDFICGKSYVVADQVKYQFYDEIWLPEPKTQGFMIGESLGSGSSGSVYNAYSLSLDMPIPDDKPLEAKHVIKIQESDKSHQILATKEYEFDRLLAKLHGVDPGIIADCKIDFFTEYDRDFAVTVTPKYAGENLHSILPKLSLAQKLDCIKLFLQDALLHKKADIVHFDIKPINMIALIDDNNILSVVIIDHGLSKKVKTICNIEAKDYIYYDPEIRGETITANFSDDVYSLGITILQTLTSYEALLEIFKAPKTTDLKTAIKAKLDIFLPAELAENFANLIGDMLKPVKDGRIDLETAIEQFAAIYNSYLERLTPTPTSIASDSHSHTSDTGASSLDAGFFGTQSLSDHNENPDRSLGLSQ